MAAKQARYRESGHEYHADTCEPLVDAAEKGQVQLYGLARASYPGDRLADGDLPGLSSVGYWDAVGSQSWGLDWHRNEGIELTFLETGSLPWSLSDEDYQLQPNDLTITRPWQPHRVGNPNIKASRLHWIIIDVHMRRPNQDWGWPKWLVLSAEDMAELTMLLRHNEQPVWHISGELCHCFKKIGKILAESSGPSRISCLAVYINEVFLQLLTMLRSHDLELDPELSSTRRMVQLFLDDLSRNTESLAHPWDSRSMALECGLGATQFSHHCRQLTNMSPMQYLTLRRIELAADMLKNESSKSITDIALACGFSSSQYFATVFKRLKGCSPNSLR